MLDFLSTVREDYDMVKIENILFVYENIKYQTTSLLCKKMPWFHLRVAENESIKHLHKIMIFRSLTCRTGSTPLKDPCQVVSSSEKKVLFFHGRFVCFQEELEAVRWSQVTRDISWKMPQTDFSHFRFFDTSQPSKVEALRSTDQNRAKSRFAGKSLINQHLRNHQKSSKSSIEIIDYRDVSTKNIKYELMLHKWRSKRHKTA